MDRGMRATLMRGLSAVSLLAGLALPAAAQPDNMTRAEVALLPPVCQDVQGIPAIGWVQHYRESPRSGYWIGMLGDTFWAMHHYCWAMIWLHRAGAAGVPPQTRDHWRRTAIADFIYVIRHAKQDFVLLPEIYYRIGEVHRLLREHLKAADAFEASRRAKADYWPAYAGLADLQLDVGRRDEARRILEQGLALMPGERMLQARLEALNRPGKGGAAVSAVRPSPPGRSDGAQPGAADAPASAASAAP